MVSTLTRGDHPVRRTPCVGSLLGVTPEGYTFEKLSIEHAAGLAAAYSRNRDHLEHWDPRREPSFFTEEGQAAALAGQLASIDRGLGAGVGDRP